MSFIKYKSTYNGGKEFAGFTRQGWIAIISTPVLLFVVLPILLSVFQVVGVGEVGIVTRFGQVVGELQSGFHLIAPWPFERMTKMNIQNQKEQEDAAAATKDLQQLDTTIAINYEISPAKAADIYRRIGAGNSYLVTVLQPDIQEAVKAQAPQYNAQELVSNRTQIEANIFKELSDKLRPIGISILNVSIVNFGFSSDFSKAVESKQVAQQQALQSQYDLQTAQLKAQQQQVQAATLTPEYLQLKAIEKWDGHTPSAIGGSNIFNIPLSK